ncbi:adenosine deaminase [Actinotignum timonense]|uniref:Adenine deaminase n=2 Tax=Actinotignum TaxID=1653174 RepID=S2VGL0_9ACTO|nr:MULTISPECIES: adenosine deaminase [Actinotignum]MDK8534599.1 adenosine deaminase [Gleimia europaea]EPD26563.1 adenosine deaminase [Actinotignum schaalii FB123-CNA-2]MDK6590592.1 adenosine deaminase [Actinotignum timonense]MDK6629888.1 adenosine deaminase [Actinotignum timonense]MDK6907461.1 adenosine deaminase [Actinotignum timonense]
MTAISPFVQGLPKVELHLHIEGTLEPDLKFKLAARNGVELPYASEEEVRASYQFDDLASFLDAYYEGMSVLLTAEDFYDLAMEYFRKVARQNVRYVEMFFDPQAHTSRGVEFHTVISGLRRAQIEAREQLGVDSALIMCFLRDFQAEYAMATLLESLPYRPWIIGVGLDSDETGNPPAKFGAVFAKARELGYQLTMHCDVDIADSAEHIRQVLEDVRVDRVDHGTNVVEKPELVEYMAEHGIGLTSCPISNTWVSDGSKVGLLTELDKRGVKVTVNSDDPAYFGGYIAENYQRVADEAGADEETLKRFARNAVDISWAPASLKERIAAEIAAYEG